MTASTRAPVAERDRADPFQVDHRDLLARAQVLDRRLPVLRGDAEGHAVATPATVEPEDDAGNLRGAAVNVGIDAQAAVQPVQARVARLDVVESGLPDQRPVSENPAICAHGPFPREMRRSTWPVSSNLAHST